MALTIPNYLKKEYPFASNFATLKTGHKIHYIDEGQGKTIVMVHGNPTWSYYYRHLISLLSKDFRVIALDHLGCGLSDKPQGYPYRLRNHVDNLREFLEILKIEKYSLVVHDWGGAIGLGVATEKPENVEGLILLNTAAFTDTHIPFRINVLRNRFWGEKVVRLFNAFARPATTMAVKKPLEDDQKDGYLLPYRNYHDRIATARFVQDIPMNSMHPSWRKLKAIEEALPNLECPKLILWGGEDFCFNMHFFRRWKEIYPSAESVLYSKAGHYVLEDAKEEINSKIAEFFNGI